MEEGFKACPWCAEPIREAATVCRYCNRPVASPATAQPIALPPPATSKRGMSGLRIVIAALICVLAAMVIVRMATRPVIPPTPGASASRVPAPNFAVERVPVTRRLLAGHLDVGNSQIRWFNFTVPPNCTQAMVRGDFHAFGGEGNDIQVIVTDSFDFENWENGHETRLFYNSDKVTNATLQVGPLAPGDYVLAFDNRFSPLSRKEVTGDISLTYLQP
jgi:hypothetical protein